MLAEIDSAELTEWMAYDRIDPFGEQRADLRAGIIASASVNHSMSPPKEPARPSDFMVFSGEAAPPQAILLDDAEAQSKLMKQSLFGAKGK